MRIKRQKLEPDTEQLSGYKLGQEFDKAIHCHPVYLTYVWRTTREMLG